MSASQLLTLAESELDPDARESLAALMGVAATALDPMLAAVLAEFEYEIFALADGARDHDRQKIYFDTVREARRARDQLAPRVLQLLEHTLARGAAQADTPAHLVEGALAAREAAALQELAGTSAQKYERLLPTLAQRYARAVGAPDPEPGRFVLGPDAVLDILRTAVTEFTQAGEHRVIFYRVLDKHWLTALRDIYEQANRTLAQSGAATQTPPPAPRAEAPAPPAAPPGAESEPAHGAGTAPASPVLPAVSPTAAPDAQPAATAAPVVPAPPAAPARPAPALRAAEYGELATPLPARFLRDGSADLSGLSNPLKGWPLIGLSCFAQSALREPIEAGLRDQYAKARDVLIARRQGERNAAPASTGAQSQSVANSEDMQLVLSVMHFGPFAATPDPCSFSRSFTHLKQDIVNQMRQFTPDGKPPRLSDADSATFELVGMMFDELVAEAPADANLRTLLGELRMPILRVALADKRFFTHAQHPARVLVAVVLEQILHWHETEQDTAIAMVRLEDMVERMTGYKGSKLLFDEILGEYRAHQELAARKAELLERRQIEGAAGRERLQLARREAESAVAGTMANGDPPPLVRQLLEQDWVRLLALTNLGEGPTSPTYRNRLAVAGRLIALFDRAHAAAPAHRDEEEFLSREIAQGLSKVGYLEGETRHLTARLFGANPAHVDPSTLLHPPAKDAAAAPPPPQIPHLGARDRQIQAQLGANARGAWLDFVVGRNGATARRKLAWIDQSGEQCLLVNQRGTRVGESSLVWIAHEIRSGRARVVPDEVENVVDRALRTACQKAGQTLTQPEAIRRA